MRVLWAALAAVALAGCTTMNVDQYQDQGPAFVLEEYFDGRLEAWGVIESRSGKILRQFKVTIDGDWDGATLTLDENFTYSDGSTENRVWRITKTGENAYEGRADDVVGVAVGRSAGNALNWRYLLNYQGDSRTFRLGFDDWMYLQPDGVLINRATMKWWGLRAGEVTIAFKRVDAPTSDDGNAISNDE